MAMNHIRQLGDLSGWTVVERRQDTGRETHVVGRVTRSSMDNDYHFHIDWKQADSGSERTTDFMSTDWRCDVNKGIIFLYRTISITDWDYDKQRQGSTPQYMIFNQRSKQ